MKHIRMNLFTVSVVAFAVMQSHAAPVAIDTTFVNPSPANGTATLVENEALIGFQTADGLFTDLNIAQATAIGNTGAHYHAPAGTDPGDGAGSDLLHLSSGNITDGVANVQSVTFDLGVTVNDRSAHGFFMYEINIVGQAGDRVTVVPLDASGVAIGDFTLEIVAGNYGAQGDFDWDPPTDDGGNLPVIFARGTTFRIGDFIGTGTLNGVAGLRFDDLIGSGTDGGDWDPSIAGTFALPVPEPTTALLGMMGLIGIGARRRRTA